MGQRIVKEWHCPSCTDNDTLIEMINTAIAAERQKAERLVEAAKEDLSGHDNLYRAHFGEKSNPADDIATKALRKALTHTDAGEER